jgi:hypothetical protein
MFSPKESSILLRDDSISMCSFEVERGMVSNLKDVSSDNTTFDTIDKSSNRCNGNQNRTSHNCYFDYVDVNGAYVCSGGLVKFNTTLEESELVFKVPKSNIGSLKEIFTHLVLCIATRGLHLHSIVCTLPCGEDLFVEKIVDVLHDLDFFDGGVETTKHPATRHVVRKYKHIIVAKADASSGDCLQRCSVCRRPISGRAVQEDTSSEG